MIGGVPLGGVIFALCVLMAVAPIRSPRWLGVVSWISSASPNEVLFPERSRLPWPQILLPWPFRPRAVERLADIPYGDGGRDNRLDVYRHRSGPVGAPTLIYLHGGSFRWGRKNFEARPLIHHLARQGWTCISANHSPRASAQLDGSGTMFGERGPTRHPAMYPIDQRTRR